MRGIECQTTRFFAWRQRPRNQWPPLVFVFDIAKNATACLISHGKLRFATEGNRRDHLPLFASITVADCPRR